MPKKPFYTQHEGKKNINERNEESKKTWEVNQEEKDLARWWFLVFGQPKRREINNNGFSAKSNRFQSFYFLLPLPSVPDPFVLFCLSWLLCKNSHLWTSNPLFTLHNPSPIRSENDSWLWFNLKFSQCLKFNYSRSFLVSSTWNWDTFQCLDAIWGGFDIQRWELL